MEHATLRSRGNGTPVPARIVAVMPPPGTASWKRGPACRSGSRNLMLAIGGPPGGKHHGPGRQHFSFGRIIEVACCSQVFGRWHPAAALNARRAGVRGQPARAVLLARFDSASSTRADLLTFAATAGAQGSRSKADTGTPRQWSALRRDPSASRRCRLEAPIYRNGPN